MESMVSNVNIHFYKKNTVKDTALYYLSAYGYGHSDSLLYDSIYKSSDFSLPLNQTSDTSKFILDISLITDTIHIPDSIYLKDTIYYNPLPDTQKIYIDTFKVVNKPTLFHETLNISYSRKLVFVSHECGFTYDIVLDSAWSSKIKIDSIFIGNSTIERGSEEENVKIFL
jgi:hypothetical protein